MLESMLSDRSTLSGVPENSRPARERGHDQSQRYQETKEVRLSLIVRLSNAHSGSDMKVEKPAGHMVDTSILQ
jgi:hypothetical protein